jgi:hypothetical protein
METIKACMAILGLAFLVIGLGCPAKGQTRLPTTPGTCVLTSIASIGTRLEDAGRPIPSTGSAVTFANKGYQVSYSEEPPISRSRRGDPVYMCLMRGTKGCPPGDNRGRIYTTTNLRTMESWTLPDSEHGCGGA